MTANDDVWPFDFLLKLWVAISYFFVRCNGLPKLYNYETKQEETTLVQHACAKVAGFKSLHKRLKKKIIVSEKSPSTPNNYMRCIAYVALHF